MLARRLTTILPEMTLAEAIDTTRIHSVAGLTGDSTVLVTTRPFRAPHHTSSDVGLIGGGRCRCQASGVIYAGLAFSAGQHLLGSGTGQNSHDASQAWTARLLAHRFGPWLVGVVGCAILAFAGVQVWLAVTAT